MSKRIKITEIRTDAGTQTRCCIIEDVVADYADRRKAGDEFPPVIVFHDGTAHYLADGFHRVMAEQRIGNAEIAADVRKGTQKDALKYALGANRTNGLRRTNADKRRCVWLALEHFNNMSDRAIAETCGVGNKFAGDVRREFDQQKDLLCSEHSSKKRTGKDGKERKLPTVKARETQSEKDTDISDEEPPRVRAYMPESEPVTEPPKVKKLPGKPQRDPPTLALLKLYWEQATGDERATFQKWIKGTA